MKSPLKFMKKREFQEYTTQLVKIIRTLKECSVRKSMRIKALSVVGALSGVSRLSICG